MFVKKMGKVLVPKELTCYWKKIDIKELYQYVNKIILEEDNAKNKQIRVPE